MADADADTRLIAVLQRLLKPRTNTSPKKELITIALALSRDPSLDAGKVCREAGFFSSDTRRRIEKYRDRMLAEGLLARAQQEVEQTQPAPPPPIGLNDQLMVQRAWMELHTPRILELKAEPLVICSDDDQHATRILFARIRRGGSHWISVAISMRWEVVADPRRDPRDDEVDLALEIERERFGED